MDPAPELTPAEQRLLELLEAMGSVDAGALRRAERSLLNARRRGESLELTRLLLARGLVTRASLSELLGDEDERAVTTSALGPTTDTADGEASARHPSGPMRAERSGRAPRGGSRRAASAPPDVAPEAGERAALPPGVGPDEESATCDGPLPAGAFDESATNPDGVAEDDSCRALEEGALQRASARKSRALKRVSNEELPTTRTVEDETASMGGLEVETRRFDADALAAASQRPVSRGRVALMGGLAVTLALVGGGLLALRSGRQPEPTPPAPLPLDPPPLTPDDEPAFGGEVPAPGADPTAPAELLATVAEQADALTAREDYGAALALYRGLPAPLRQGEAGDAVAAAISRLEALEAYRREAQALLEALGTGEGPAGAQAEARVRAFLEGKPALRDSPTGKRLDAALLELSLARADAAERARVEPSAREEPPERAQRLEALAARGRQIVQAIKLAIEQEQQWLVQVEQDEVVRARTQSEANPLELELSPGVRVRDAVVVGLTRRDFTIRTSGGAVVYAWDAVDPDVALAVRRLPVRADAAEDQLRFGQWCLEQRLFDEAREAFSQAVLLDPKLKAQVPDVSAIARAARIFNGRLERSGSTIGVTYEFARGAELDDWRLPNGARGGLDSEAQRFEVHGEGVYLARLKEVGFEERLELNATLGAASRGAANCFGVVLNEGSAEERTLLAAVNRTKNEVMLVRLQGGTTEIVQTKKGILRPSHSRLTFALREGKLLVRLHSRVLFREDVGTDWGSIRVVLGGASTRAGSVSFEQFTVRGQVRYEWLRKAFGEFDALLKGLLARSDELRVFAQPAGKPKPEPLSAEDEWAVEGVPPLAEAAYQKGRLKAALGLEGGERGALDLLAAAAAFSEAIDQAPRFAAAYYRRALVLEALGRPVLALAELERALDGCPRFYEALAARARLLAERERLEEAEAAANEALQHRPDYAPAYAARALVWFHRDDLPRALADLDLALALDPWDDEVRSFRKSVKNVLKGPPWERTFRKRTTHYLVKTDISQARCDEYADELEAVRGFYGSLFGTPDTPEGEGHQAEVLLFDTQEGFHAYAELTTDDRVESLLGYYLPRYRQLLLYEDKDDEGGEETRRVLFHEAFHQFIDERATEVPFWLNEGFAEYFSTCRVEGGEVRGRGGRLEGRLRDLRRFVSERGQAIPFARLMQETPRQFYSGPVAVKYAQAWSMVHFFLHGAPDADRERFRHYVRLLLDGAPGQKAFDEAWSRADWPALERAWWSHVERAG